MKKLTKREQKEKAWEAYEAIQAPAWKAYQAIEAPAWKAYQAIKDPAWKAYLAKCDEIEQQEDDDIRIIDGKRYKLIEEK